jgi:multiple sugar transport system ATP-binding protein
VDIKVDVTELMGNEIFMFMLSGDDSFVGRFDPRTNLKSGDQGQAVFNMLNMQLFETEGAQVAIR